MAYILNKLLYINATTYRIAVTNNSFYIDQFVGLMHLWLSHCLMLNTTISLYFSVYIRVDMYTKNAKSFKYLCTSVNPPLEN